MLKVLKENPKTSTIGLARLCCPKAGDYTVESMRSSIYGWLVQMEKCGTVTSYLVYDPHTGRKHRTWTYTGRTDGMDEMRFLPSCHRRYEEIGYGIRRYQDVSRMSGMVRASQDRGE